MVPQLVNIWFQVLFHSPPGVLFTFPSQYYALSVTKEYLALRGGPRVFSQGSTCLDLLWIPPCQSTFHLRGFHLSGRTSQSVLLSFASIPQSEPRDARITVGALSISLAATLEIDKFSFSSSGYLDVSVPRVPHVQLCIHCTLTEVSSAGFPHSDISGSSDMCSSPKLFAGLITSFIGS